MAGSRRLSNGRSPLVRKQCQITSFFSTGKNPDENPNPGPNCTPSPGRTPLDLNRKKPRLVVGPTPDSDSKSRTPSSGKKSYAEEVVGRRVKVFWPLDKTWYEGCVKSFDEGAGKHVVQYDDAEEEVLDLQNENVEWVEVEAPRSFRRLRPRRISLSMSVTPDKGREEGESVLDDSTDDEDWAKGTGEVAVEDESDEMELEVEDREEGMECSKRDRARMLPGSGSSKRKQQKLEKVDSSKKSRASGNGGTSLLKLLSNCGEKTAVEPARNIQNGKALDFVDDTLTCDAGERFAKREAEKFRFLGNGRKDACGRHPEDENYDPKTLQLPQEFLRNLPAGQRQWWEFKSKHMDKVLFFKMGKFYELFEMDAHIGAKELDLQYMKGEQPHCGFPEKNFSMNLEKLARKGYRVLVVEQTETPEQLELRRKELGSKDKVVKREVCAVVSKGTLTEGELLSTNPDASYLLSLTEKRVASDNQNEGTVLGVCVVDVSTSKFIVGQFEDDSERHLLCSLLSELRPVEIIKPRNVLSPETEGALQKHTRSPLVSELIPLVEFWDSGRTIDEVRNVYQPLRNSPVSESLENGPSLDSNNEGNRLEGIPDVLSRLISSGENGIVALSAFGGCLYYLRQALLDETLLRCGKFEPLLCSGSLNTLQKRHMILDAAALENLEILENRDGGLSGTLFAQLDHCVTAFGKRLLKSWLARPLYDASAITERQDAVVYLKGAQASALEFRKQLSRLPDMERLLARLFASCEASGRNANKVVLYEDEAKKQLQEFISTLRGCLLMAQACSSLSLILTGTESCVLHHILTPGKGLPDINSVINHFKDAFDWSEADISGRIVPHEGADKEYDFACEAVKEIESNLTRHLKEQRRVLGEASINYVTVGKEIYLLEIPENLRESIPQDYELRSSKKGYFRYWTPKIKVWLVQLSQAEAEKESKLRSIRQRLVGQFSEHHGKWRQLVSATAELDVLISFAIASEYYEGPTCRPVIKAASCSFKVSPSLTARGLGHPILRSEALGKGSFVPNDVSIGGDGKANFMLLTGPNMGGKSTLLRQVCMAVILAQLGADVPAESFELSPVDCIFVRMGARDQIMAGQSTFLTELSETASMLASATHNSLVVLDELGRGTSTSDGQAIAQSVLEYFLHVVQCRCLFSTHYHRLAVDYEKDPKVYLCHMACKVGKGVGDVEEVTFLYRLTRGSCPKSYGVNVARLAGIPATVLQKAAAKSSEFEAFYGNGRQEFENGPISHDKIAVLQGIFRATSERSCHESTRTTNLKQLVELQQKAKLLLHGI